MHNPLQTPICDRLGIEYPVFLAGMGGVSLSRLVAAVSNAGGLGIMGAATLGPAELREEIQKTRDLTDRPFAVDLLAPLPDRIRPQMEVLFEEDVRVFVAGLAVPAEFIAEMHERDMTVMVMCGRVRHAQKSEEAGADIVAAQGTVAALALGAQGAIFGTRFIASPEAQAAPGYRDAIVGATEADTVRTRCYTGKPARAIRNQYTDEWEQKADQIQPFPMQAGISIQNRVMDYMGVGNTFDANRTFLPAGQSAGLVHEIKPAGQIVRDIIEEARQVIESRFVEPSLEKQQV